ncbi:hypothetical protein LOD99_6477 [Oopsacas minuta]|uniref:Uncharacterized protein n=1 Tax=Oopsacas minuta TaxID=111878 RepID=A0AAV7JLU0_9METZ|nr:hypothetical protein LOD99_6477 [Oopsacas minuta]
MGDDQKMSYNQKMRREESISHFLTQARDSGYVMGPDNADTYTYKLIQTMTDQIEKMTNIPPLKNGLGYMPIGYTAYQHGFQHPGMKYERRIVSLYVKLYSDHRGGEQKSKYIEEDEKKVASLREKLYTYHRGVEQKSQYIKDDKDIEEDEYRFGKLYFIIEIERDIIEWKHRLTGKWYMDRLTKSSDYHVDIWGLPDSGNPKKRQWVDLEPFNGDFPRLPVREGQRRFV